MSQTEMDKVMKGANNKFTIAVVLGIAVLAAYVLLVLFAPPGVDDRMADAVLTFGTSFAVLIGVTSQIDKTNAKADDIGDKVATIEKNTNGVLSKHVDDVADAAVQKALNPPADITKVNGK